MKVIADLHIHSRFSRATSSELNIANLVKYARLKGVNVLGSGDFTHPSWLAEVKRETNEDGTGMLKTKDGFPFVLSGEISSIYSQDKALRRIHNVVLSPDIETAEQINETLRGRNVKIESDGRPICGIPAHELVELIMEINPRNEVIPAHVWTPWFSLFGSKSGFDRLEDCFKDQTKNIHAIETGLSSDPPLNWRLSQLDDLALVSFSDAHSFWPWRVGREATIFELKELTYDNMISAIRTREGLEGTIEVDPSYGKYHFDGHRDCNVSLSPAESEELKNICPVCRRPLTIGVLHRIEELADRPEGFRPEGAKPFHSLIPLSEMIASVMKVNVASSKVWEEYNNLLKAFGTELNVLTEAAESEMRSVTHEKVAETVMAVRGGKIKIRPGYDGVYGEVEDSSSRKKEMQKRSERSQKTLGEF